MVGGVLLIILDLSFFLWAPTLFLNFRRFYPLQILSISITSLSYSPFLHFSLNLIFLEKGISLFLLLSCNSSMAPSRWIRPEVFPLFASVGVAVGICGMQLLRNITTNPEVRVTKENRAAGVLDNFKEGEKYAEHGLRKYVRKRTPQIMPSINGFFSDPDLPTN
ncbi:hypothetical protein POPTR_010G055300v4 [Populus trichocarpa]|uniref:NADH-ubiquinone reductase complex 1 MLRQ subunit n=1 Tax=Populus trichocarpa TaxID=3694 RepID=A0A3N7FKK8_POPTR|nr:uncharacterized protein LOC7460039 [Populus trichocarpa]KAI5572955.1 hypothetical protein BDE02_10G047300 [Populus trichocarpa]RQO96297.1 hypothetical protein POPTR_010G055300v4 [Populus trichocarpa]|eukprot:XP_002314553.2 uncharacterized protein LOC7460039 [Populus trichocarpa]